MENLHQEQKHEHFTYKPIKDFYRKPFSQKSWFKRVKQRFIELAYDSRNKVAHTQTTIKNHSNIAIQKIVDRPLLYLITASALGFLLSFMFHRK